MTDYIAAQRTNLVVWLRRAGIVVTDERVDSIIYKLHKRGLGSSVLKGPLAVAVQLYLAKQDPSFNRVDHWPACQAVASALADFIRGDIEYPYSYKEVIRENCRKGGFLIMNPEMDARLVSIFPTFLQRREVDKARPTIAQYIVNRVNAPRHAIGDGEFIISHAAVENRNALLKELGIKS